MLYLFTLLLEMLHLRCHGALFGIVGGEGIRRAIELFLGFVVRGCQVSRAGVSNSDPRKHSPGDPIDQCSQAFAVLARNALDVTLEDEKVLRLDQDIEIFELGVVRLVCGFATIE
jgi:hypothetical protein